MNCCSDFCGNFLEIISIHPNDYAYLSQVFLNMHELELHLSTKLVLPTT